MAEKKTGFMAEFKKFIMRGNVLDMAVGMVVGSAFTAIVQSVVKDIINPVVGLLIGKIDFQELRVVLKPATEAASEVAIRYGALIQNILQFLSDFGIFPIQICLSYIKQVQIPFPQRGHIFPGRAAELGHPVGGDFIGGAVLKM